MRGLKRGIAFAMASTMLLGSGISAMATDDDTSSVTGDGHYTQENIEETISVTLPTQPEGETPFDYVMDPDGNVPRLVDNGSAAFGEDVDVNNLPGLYYVTGTERIRGKDVPVFSAKSASLKLVNESAYDVAIGVDFEVKAGGEDFSNDDGCYEAAKIRGVSQLDDAQQNELMLSLYASDGDEETDDKETPVFVEGQDYDAVSETVYACMEGNEDNFVFTLTEEDGPDYMCEYNRKQNVESWPAVDFYMSGKINEFVDELPDVLVRPRVIVTWSAFPESAYNELVGNDNAFDELRELRKLDTYEDPVGPAQPSIDGDFFAAENVPEGEPLVVHFNKGDSEGITSLQYFNGNTWATLSSNVDFDNEAGTITFAPAYVDSFRGIDGSRTWRATFAPIGEDDPVSKEFMIVSEGL